MDDVVMTWQEDALQFFAPPDVDSIQSGENWRLIRNVMEFGHSPSEAYRSILGFAPSR
jgi:hypothetical protein